MSKQSDFISVIAPLARAEYTNRNKWVLPSVCISQAALESGWNVNAKTLFGIKGNGSALQTVEYINGKYQSVTASFKSYPNVSAAVHGYYDLICGSSRYSGAVNNPDYVAAIHAIKAGGYATDPSYTDKIISIIKQWNLIQYDKKLRVSSPVSQSVENHPVFTYGKDYRVTASALRVRFQPTRYSKIRKMYPSGTVFTCLQVIDSSDGVWIRTPSGWVCGYDKTVNKYYAVDK